MMTQLTKMLRHSWMAVSGLALLVSFAPASAQTANADGITLSAYPPAAASVDGRIVGSFSLSNIASSDQNGNLCAGFADTNPSHILTLENDFPSLTITVNSGEDTTLLIQGPDDNSIHCGQDISRWLAEKKYRPRIDRILPLTEAATAHQLQEESTVENTGALAGKIVVKP